MIRLHLYDTTLRDGAQTQGVQFSAAEKIEIARMLDALGVDMIEGGWPGANPTDDEFFSSPPRLRATLSAFGMTRRAERSAGNDETLSAVLNAGTRAVCLVGKTDARQVADALGVSLDDNLAAIRDSIAHVVAQGREALFDAEHFFDGHARDPGYARACLSAAGEAGARWVVLCDTNGGTLPPAIGAATADAATLVGAEHLGIHCHDDTGTAVAGSLAAIEAGARQIQGTLGGLGERCGNASLTTLIATLALKPDLAARYATGVTPEALARLTPTSRRLDEILNRTPSRGAPYVGTSAFVHKAGLHASAILKNPASYEHVAPEAVGNARVIPMSNQAGQANLRARLAEAGLSVAAGDPALAVILDTVKAREEAGYAYDGAQASFELLAREALGRLPAFFEVERYRVTVERRRNALGRRISVSEAVVVVQVGGRRVLSVSESHDAEGQDRGPVNALWNALAKDLGPYQAAIDDMALVDFRVRITGGGTEAATRVTIDSRDRSGQVWSTVGVSANIVDASFEALVDAIRWKLVRDGATPA